MTRVLVLGTSSATVAYCSAGIFGYATFAANPNASSIYDAQNILEGPYGQKVAIYIALFGIMIVVGFASPFCVLPTKDSFEEVFGAKMTAKQNVLATFGLCAFSFVIAAIVPTIGDIMTILGATTNSAIGFLLPIVYYLKLERKAPRFSNKKVVAYFVFVLISLCSVIELTTFVMKKANS